MNRYAATVSDLIPGNRVYLEGPEGERSATYVGRLDPHPLYRSLVLVVWYLDDETWSHDALAARQFVGVVDAHETPGDRNRNLRSALLGLRL